MVLYPLQPDFCCWHTKLQMTHIRILFAKYGYVASVVGTQNFKWHIFEYYLQNMGMWLLLLAHKTSNGIYLNIICKIWLCGKCIHACAQKSTRLHNKVRELATVCLLWQHWTKALVWFDDDISAFHSCDVVDLWQSLSERHLLLFGCVLVCCRKNVRA